MANRRGRPSSSSAALPRATEKPRPVLTAAGTQTPSSSAIHFLRKHAVGWLVLSCLVPVGLCLAKLNDDLWYDEIYTLSFAEQSYASIARDYSAPNNHVLYTLLLSPIYAIYANNSMLRLPSLVSTVLTLTFVFYLGRRAGRIPTAVAAVTLLGLNQMFLGHTMQVRGYSLSMALAAALGLLVLQAGSRSWSRAMAIIMLTAALMYTIPTNAIFAASFALTAMALGWLQSRRWKDVLFEAAIWGAGAALAAVVYLPIYEQVLAARSTATENPWFSTIGLTVRFYWAALHDYVFLAPIASLGGVRLVRSFFHPRSAEQPTIEGSDTDHSQRIVMWFFMFLIPSLFLVTALLRSSPFVRVYCPLLPFTALLVGWMIAEGTRVALAWFAQRRSLPEPRNRVVAVVGVSLIMLATLPWLATYSKRLAAVSIDRFAQDGYYNYYSANYFPSRVVDYLRQRISPEQPYIICFDDADMLNLRWYLAHAKIAPGRLRDTPEGESVAQVFLVLPPRPHFERVSFETGISEEYLRSLPMVADFGYYKVFSSPEFVSLSPVSPQKAPQ